MADFVRCFMVVKDFDEETSDMNYCEFRATFCMIAEEYCKRNDLDVCEFMQDMLNATMIINEECGKY